MNNNAYIEKILWKQIVWNFRLWPLGPIEWRYAFNKCLLCNCVWFGLPNCVGILNEICSTKPRQYHCVVDSELTFLFSSLCNMTRFVFNFSTISMHSDAGRWKTLGVPVVIGGDNLPSSVGIGLTELPLLGGGGAVAPGFRHHCMHRTYYI